MKFKKNPTIQKQNYKNKKEYYFDEKTDVVPKIKNRLLCIIFSEDKGCYFIFRKFDLTADFDFFRFKRGMYIIDNEAVHITANGDRVAFYFEGVSTPLKMSNIEKEIKTIEYKDLLGNKQKSIIQKIKGLKFDSKILDTFANRRFAEIFTKKPIDNFQLLILIFSIITMVMIGISYFLTYWFGR